jgi:hypothetical protein
MMEEGIAAGEGGIEDLHIESRTAQVGTEIQDAQRRIGLHDLHLFGIFVEKVTMSEQKVHYEALPEVAAGESREGPSLRRSAIW